VFAEANKILASAIKKNTFVELDIAQGLMEVAKADLNRVTAAVERCREQRQSIDCKRQKYYIRIPHSQTIMIVMISYY
jgi:hypothetical protein